MCLVILVSIFVNSQHCLYLLLACCLSSAYWVLFFFFKQKTAYEMRISDWSSDVCSSDLARRPGASAPWLSDSDRKAAGVALAIRAASATSSPEIGRASCRERVCQYV